MGKRARGSYCSSWTQRVSNQDARALTSQGHIDWNLDSSGNWSLYFLSVGCAATRDTIVGGLLPPASARRFIAPPVAGSFPYTALSVHRLPWPGKGSEHTCVASSCACRPSRQCPTATAVCRGGPRGGCCVCLSLVAALVRPHGGYVGRRLL